MNGFFLISKKYARNITKDTDNELFIFCCFSFLGSCEAFPEPFDDDEFYDGVVSPLRAYATNARSRRSPEDKFSTIKDAESLIPSNYSIHEPPPTNNSEPTGVDFSVLIMNVRDIKELNEELSLEMNLRIYWKDTRLSHLADRSGDKFIVLNPKLVESIWMPDIFIDHVKSVQQPALITKPASLRVYPDSSVRYSARCNVDMKSYAYSSQIMALDWREGKGALLVDFLELPNFDVALDTTQNFMVNTSSGSYSGIRFTILLRRKLSYHLIQTYLPSTLFIIVSWLSFLVPPESVPGRMALCMTTLLTLTAMFSAVRLAKHTERVIRLRSKKTKPPPKISSTVAALTQNGTQPMIGYRTYGEFPSLQHIKQYESSQSNGVGGDVRRRSPPETNGPTPPDPTPVPAKPVPPPPPSQPPPPLPAPPPPVSVPHPIISSTERALSKYELAAKKIEKFTSIVIPSLFIVFNFIYWPWLIESANYYDHRKSSTVYHAL
ncbi:Gamma-aminobutyric acid receptor subunit rho-2 [Folsomia candida]|uniref:Gamma-aminobutyric acid receptor subunit rho-2 n=1 Tax=Folsomia candida TaxID=158441 RepID=A0A226EHG4_FOLCA|nr:Gamma-aminobutyric acid receptor subunit rho-2 [Folsomia candida]